MSIDGLMPPNLVNMTAMIRDFSAYEVFAQHNGQSFSFVIDGDVMTATYSTPRHTSLHMTLKRLE
jgi:hypothetical protein